MFLFDVSDTEPEEDAAPLPPEVERPFEVRGGRIGDELGRMMENAKRDGVRVERREAGSQSAGEIGVASGGTLRFQARSKPEPAFIDLPVRYQLLLNARHTGEAQYATLIHELAHLYCGHLGTPDPRSWPDRSQLSNEVEEFEAESVSYLLCGRAGIDSPSAEYLGSYLRMHSEPPNISLECVLKSAGLIEQMGREHLKPRKDPE
jgi:hypothetical protein